MILTTAEMTDGYCSFTCSTFLKQMKSKGVKSIVFGGRPQYGPMQAMGGVKGLLAADFETAISQFTTAAYQVAMNSTRSSAPVLSQAQFEQFNATTPIPLESFPLIIRSVSVNFRNSYDPDDAVTPLQFIYEASECRLFYTFDNYIRQETTWVAAAQIFLNRTCVQGSVGPIDWEAWTPETRVIFNKKAIF
jgi:hypothetical protein